MTYKMRTLKTSDIFKMSKILKKLEVKTNDIKLEEGMTTEQVGVTIILKAVENLHMAEDEVNDFISGLVGITAEEFGELPIEDTLSIISQFKEQKGIASFLQLAGR